MSAAILTFPDLRAQRANCAGQAVAIAAKRLGFRPYQSEIAAQLVRREVLAGRKTAGRAVADMKRDLSHCAHFPKGVA